MKKIVSSIAHTNSSNSVQYPCLMEGDTYIVLFSHPGKGTVVYVKGGEPHYGIGYYQTGWWMEHFKPYDGSPITLEMK